MTMRVKTARWQREMSMESWSEGTDKTLVKILGSPALMLVESGWASCGWYGLGTNG